MSVWLVILIWMALSLPIGIVVGKIIAAMDDGGDAKASSRERPAPLPVATENAEAQLAENEKDDAEAA